MMATSQHGGMAATAFEALKARLWGFMQAEIYPNEQLFAAQSKARRTPGHSGAAYPGSPGCVLQWRAAPSVASYGSRTLTLTLTLTAGHRRGLARLALAADPDRAQAQGAGSGLKVTAAAGHLGPCRRSFRSWPSLALQLAGLASPCSHRRTHAPRSLDVRPSSHTKLRHTHGTHPVAFLAQAKAQGLWNLFLPVDSAAVAGVDQSVVGGGLTNRQYAEICDPNPSPN